MSISFYLYVETNNGYEFAPGTRDRMDAEIMPAYDTPEYETWTNGGEDTPNPLYDDRLDINLNNRNGKLVLNELGMLGPDEDIFNSDPLPLNAFAAGLKETMRRNPDPIPGFDGYERRGEGLLTVIGAGVADGYVNWIMKRLARMVEAGKEYSATHIGWG